MKTLQFRDKIIHSTHLYFYEKKKLTERIGTLCCIAQHNSTMRAFGAVDSPAKGQAHGRARWSNDHGRHAPLAKTAAAIQQVSEEKGCKAFE